MLHIHRAERADALVEALRSLLATPLDDPFAAELIAVPTRGMERWLSQRMSEALGASPGRMDGVCANVVFPSPYRLLNDAVAAGSGVEPAEDPWRPERSVWPLLDVLEARFGEPWLQPVATYLGGAAQPDPVRRARRLSLARHVAGLFDRYALYRPDMVAAWSRGTHTDGSETPIRTEAAWQPELWRELRTRIGTASPDERRAEACTRLRDDPSVADLPDRLSVFGLTRLPAGHAQLLQALAARRHVHLFLLHPSPVLWTEVARAVEDGSPRNKRSEDPTAALPSNRLLASWGRDAREMQLVLAEHGPSVDHHHGLGADGDTLLTRIQADVRSDRRPAGVSLPGEADERPTLAEDDRSLEIHSCHGKARQVEVARDAILHALAEDPTLEPRDVIVLCPDIEAFAPLIQATFGAGEVSSDADTFEPVPRELRPVDLRVRLADRSLRQTNPILGVVSRLLELVGQRMTASQVLDFADREPVRHRFRLDDDDLTRVQDWIAASGIRWGLDEGHRKPFKLDNLPYGTWRFGLDRVLLGVTMTEDEQRRFGDVLPLDDVDSRAIDLAGRFAELIARVEDSMEALSSAKAIDAWAETIGVVADSLTSTRGRDAWQRAELERILSDLVAEATTAGAVSPTPLALEEVRDALADRLQGRPTRANFRTGHLTICTLVPMRSVPHRVVCLLGLDDGAFPRKAPRDGDDLTLDDPRVGERDRRTEDRQLLLDALLAATDRLIITYTGNDERTNTRRPPAVPVGELLDVVDATVQIDEGPARDRVVIRHPLQPFDQRNFAPDALVPARTWSFDSVTLEGARALTQPRSEPGPFLPNALPPLDTTLIEVDDLVRFVQHPVRAFLRKRLGITLRQGVEEIEDDLTVELDGLGTWGVGQRLLEARQARVDGRTAVLAEIARGTLPPGALGRPAVEQAWPIVDAILSTAMTQAKGDAAAAPVDVRLTLARGARLAGTVADMRGDVLLTTAYSRVAPKHRVAAWVRLLALTAAAPERAFSAVTVGRAQKNGTVAIARILPLADLAEQRREIALDHLATLADLYERGMREPLPLYCDTSAAYAERVAEGKDPVPAAAKAWTSAWNFDKEDKEPEHQLVLGGVRTFDELVVEAPRSGEEAPGWEPAEKSRLGRYARRLWDGLLNREELTVL